MKKDFWWYAGCLLISFMIYEKMLKGWNRDTALLLEKKSALEKEKMHLLEEKKRLQDEIYSQNDPDWVELTLMKVLGVVPENTKKVYFVTPPLP